jgi:hypothetical protein
LLWFGLWLATAATRAAATESLEMNPAGVVAAVSQLLRVLVGLEWRTGEFGRQWVVLPPVLAITPVVIAVLLSRRSSAGDTKGLLPALAGWVLLASLPVAAVASIWSAYYYLFALAGLALVMGWVVQRQPRWVAAVVVVALGWVSHGARQVDEFASGPGYWTAQSHVNFRYHERATSLVASYLDDLTRQQPRVPENSTFFFSNIPGFVAWQAGDGPLVRWAYRDTSLRSYYLASITTERARRGPRFFFLGNQNRLVQWQESPAEFLNVATGMTLAGREEQAREMLELVLDEAPRDTLAHYRLAWLEWSLGDSAGAIERLTGIGMHPSRGPTPELVMAREHWQAGRGEEAKTAVDAGLPRHVLDSSLHYTLAYYLHAEGGESAGVGVFEALAARVLDPTSADIWKLWARYQWQAERVVPAVRSVQRYLELGGDAADPEVGEILAEGRHYEPGSEAIQRGLRE